MADKLNFSIDQGTDYSANIVATYSNNSVINLTGYSGASKMRKHYTSNTSYAFVVTIPDANNGVVNLSMNAATTSNISSGRYVWDCELTSGDATISRLREGIITIRPQVTS